MIRYGLIVLLLLAYSSVLAQEVSIGFKAGMNFSTLSGPSEVDAAGNELEEYNLTTGFIFGGRVNVKLTDYFGVRAELLYQQKGTEYSYDGQSYWRFPTLDETIVLSQGTRRTIIKITNSYLELPILGYARFGRVELSGGISAGINLSSRGVGEVIYSGVTAGGVTVDPFTIGLDQNYLLDGLTNEGIEIAENRVLDGRDVDIPRTIGAFYTSDAESDEKRFEGLDLGLNAEVAFFLNQGLYLGLRVNYGLTDVTRTEQDISKVELDASDNFIFLDDVDRNISFSLALGFGF